MEINAGEVVERIVRRNGVSITDLARRLKVNRRSVYNWFNQKTLKLELLCKIGQALNYDFSMDFLQEFKESGSSPVSNLSGSIIESELSQIGSAHYWMIKYICLLEKYNELLLKEKDSKKTDYNSNIKSLRTNSFSSDLFESDTISVVS